MQLWYIDLDHCIQALNESTDGVAQFGSERWPCLPKILVQIQNSSPSNSATYVGSPFLQPRVVYILTRLKNITTTNIYIYIRMSCIVLNDYKLFRCI